MTHARTQKTSPRCELTGGRCGSDQQSTGTSQPSLSGVRSACRSVRTVYSSCATTPTLPPCKAHTREAHGAQLRGRLATRCDAALQLSHLVDNLLPLVRHAAHRHDDNRGALRRTPRQRQRRSRRAAAASARTHRAEQLIRSEHLLHSHGALLDLIPLLLGELDDALARDAGQDRSAVARGSRKRQRKRRNRQRRAT